MEEKLRPVTPRFPSLLATLALAVTACLAAGACLPVAAAPEAFDASHRRLAEAERAIQAGEIASARDILASIRVPAGERSYRSYRLHLLHAQLALLQRKPTQAVALARQAVSLAAASDLLLDARLVLARAYRAASMPQEALETLLSVAEGTSILFRGGLRHEVMDDLAGVARIVAPDTTARRALLLRYARIMQGFGQCHRALPLLSTARWKELEPEAVLVQATCHGALGQEEQRLFVLQAAVARGRKAGWPAARLAALSVELARAFIDQGRKSQARELLLSVLSGYPGTAAAGDAAALVAWIELEAGNLGSARLRLVAAHKAASGTPGWRRALWSLFAAAYPNAPETARWSLERLALEDAGDPAYLYWQARMQERSAPTRSSSTARAASPARPGVTTPAGSGAPDGLGPIVTTLVSSQPLSYYALLARRRWPGLTPGIPRVAMDAADAGRALAAPDERLAPILASWDAGMRHEAALELHYLVEEHPASELLAILGRWGLELGDYRAAMSYFGRQLSLDAPIRAALTQPARSPAALHGSAQVLQGLFPVAFAEQVRAQASARGLDPFLLLAIMREESAFEPHALSRADAHGLMQLLPSTARGVALDERLAPPAPVDLFLPALNIRLGAAYVAQLARQFGDPRPVAAAYHAGPGRVARWLVGLPDGDMDLFVERIPIASTREYVRSVYRSYLVYRALYGEAIP